VSSDGGSPDGREELEELGHDAIVAHQTEAHLPQKRARVTEEAISVVISEPHASVEPFTPPPEESTLTHGEATRVLGDRKDLAAARRRILARRQRGKGRGMVWATLALAVVGGGALLVFLGLRMGLSERMVGAAAAPVANNARAVVRGAPSASPATGERPPRKVSLEELPVESPSRR
jgi:hypothetical protein